MFSQQDSIFLLEFLTHYPKQISQAVPLYSSQFTNSPLPSVIQFIKNNQQLAKFPMQTCSKF